MTSRTPRFALGTEQGDLGLEVLQGLEAAVHRGEAQVGHLVELSQRAEDGQTHLVGVDLSGAGGSHGLLDLLGQQRQIVLGDRTPLARLADADQHLRTAERLGGP